LRDACDGEDRDEGAREVRVTVVGATGFLGSHVVRALRERGDEVVAVSRRDVVVPGATDVRWEPLREPLPELAHRDVDAIVNLAGAPIAPGRWTLAQRERILDSRVDATRGVAAVLGDGGPGVLVNGSAAGRYGATEEAVDEGGPPGTDFLAGVCEAWEHEALQAVDRARVVVLRSGIVLARDGGAFPTLVRLARVGLLGAVGTGQQWVPWVHVDDELATVLRALDDATLSGPVNVVAPSPVRQVDLARALRRALRRPAAPPAPAALVRAALGGSSSLLLDGQHVVPGVLTAMGFRFAFPTLEPALRDLVR
jgi:uncharacterized protein (TIGR01777 family)